MSMWVQSQVKAQSKKVMNKKKKTKVETVMRHLNVTGTMLIQRAKKICLT